MNLHEASRLLPLRRYCLGLVLLTHFFSLNAWATEAEVTPQAWLVKMSKALQSLNYEGVFIHVSDGQLAAMQLKHVVDEQGEREYLVTLTGPERRVVREGVSGRFGFAKDGQGMADHLNEAEQYYDMTLLGADRVAGQPSLRLQVEPKDDYRYGYQLWLAEASGLLLRSDLINTKGNVIEQVMFTSMAVLPAGQPSTASEQAAIEKLKQTPEVLATPVTDSLWSVAQLPPGFVLASRKVHPDQGILHLIYTDGLASVSVFIEQNKREEAPFVGISRRGAVSAFGHVVNGHQTTVVGEVPEATVMLMGESIRLAVE